jgi:hypothetical protein
MSGALNPSVRLEVWILYSCSRTKKIAVASRRESSGRYFLEAWRRKWKTEGNAPGQSKWRRTVPKVCPKISNFIEIRRANKRGVLQGKTLIFCAFAFCAASYTRVKSEVRILYRPPLLFPKRQPASPSKF